VNLVATAEPNYHFTSWTGDTGTIADPCAASTTITMNDDYSITANFAINQYSLTIASTSGGTVSTPGEGTFTLDAGTVVDLVATPDADYQFVNWTGDVGTIDDVDAASTTITMNGDYSITANFDSNEYWLTIASTPGGSVTTPGEGTFGPYNHGEVVNLVATAEPNYHFTSWTGDTGTIADPGAASTTITMNDDYSITANFAINQYSLTIASTSGGTVSTPGEGTFTLDAGTVVDLVATPDADYQFVNWTGDVGTIDDVDAASTTITMNDDYSITANFATGPTGISLYLYSPADMIVTDPDGLTIGKELNEIPGATYTEIDINADGELDDVVNIPDRKIGDYLITVVPEPDASPTDMYTLEVSAAGVTIVLAENVQIADIPAEGYIVRSTKTEIIQIVPATIEFNPDTLNVRGRGRYVTVYIELPMGYDISQIDISSIRLNGTVPALTKLTEVGDYDSDGVPDLMVKLHRTAVQDALTVGEAVKVIITGEVSGIIFEGSDTIRVIGR